MIVTPKGGKFRAKGDTVMKLKADRFDIWTTSIKDKPGGLVKKIEPLAKAGVNLKFLIARRSAKRPGTGIAFASPIKGAKQARAAKKAGFKKSKSMSGLKVVCDNRKGVALKMTGAISEAGINLRGLSGATLGKQAVLYLAFDSVKDANKAARCLKKI